MNQSLQDTYGPETICFGCGPANERGLQIKSFVDGEAVVADFSPEPHHQAFPGAINGGIIGSLLDCHSNWTAAWNLMQQRGDGRLPVTVTADFHVKLRRPTPSGVPLRLVARVVESEDPRAVVEATLEADGKVCATCRATFIAVEEGHPAYHRW
jgi:acyl-coenzyme A thioesterase PaaI-like protein